jgi:hypothetical protein
MFVVHRNSENRTAFVFMRMQTEGLSPLPPFAAMIVVAP